MKKARTVDEILRRKAKLNRIIHLVITAFKSVLAVEAIALIFASLYFGEDASFALLLIFLSLVFAAISYFFALVSVIYNHFSTHLFPKYWTFVSIVSIVLLVLTISIGEMSGGYGYSWFLILLVLNFILQTVPAFIELGCLFKYISKKKKR